MSLSTKPCGNCGDEERPGVKPCVKVWGHPHTHPRAWDDLTPVPCDLMLCTRCALWVRNALAAEAVAEWRQGKEHAPAFVGAVPDEDTP